MAEERPDPIQSTALKVAERLRELVASPPHPLRALRKLDCADQLGNLKNGAPPVLDALAAILEDEDRELSAQYDGMVEHVSAHAFAALRKIGAPAIPLLTRALGSSRPTTRIEAARSLQSFPRLPAETVAALQRAAKDPDERVRAAAGRALRRGSGRPASSPTSC